MTSIPHIRWMIRRDLPEVMHIENSSFEFPWSEDDLLECLRKCDCISIVIEDNETIAGFLVYELHKSKLVVINFAVHPAYRRKGIGSQMVRYLTDKLIPPRRRRILLEIRETNLAAQLFFRACGFRAVNVLRNQYDDTNEDAYLFSFTRKGQHATI